MKPFVHLWLGYPLTKAALFLRALGWRLEAHVLVIGPLVFCVAWRKRLLP